MTLLYELISLALLYLAGSLLSGPIPVPAALMSMALFFILLKTGVLKADRYTHLSRIILANIAFFFLPPAIQILDFLDVLSGNMLKIMTVLVVSNFLVMGVSGLVVQVLMKKEEARD